LFGPGHSYRGQASDFFALDIIVLTQSCSAITSDQVDHIRLLENNTFGFEDLPNGGDKDYNNVIVQVNLSVNAV
ncbi:MAG: DUF4114 domain-containing protein, partial [Nostoc sp.]|uniref:DUF4114 domain-containing protein n=1 Tax=Nostoc sp. TaxID=1180 RepID=UPI002FF5844D